jgi:hypothetical protein
MKAETHNWQESFVRGAGSEAYPLLIAGIGPRRLKERLPKNYVLAVPIGSVYGTFRAPQLGKTPHCLVADV